MTMSLMVDRTRGYTAHGPKAISILLREQLYTSMSSAGLGPYTCVKISSMMVTVTTISR